MVRSADRAKFAGPLAYPFAAVRAFLRRVPVGYPILLDAPGPADAGVRLGNPRGMLPYSVLIGADGRLLKQRLGPFDPGELEGWAASH